MSASPLTLFVVLIVFGFLSGSTLYFYNKSGSSKSKNSAEPTFQADSLPQEQSSGPDKIDGLTAPAEPKGRLSYPSNVYKVQPKESLFAIGEKMGVSWLIVKAANGLKDENLIQADYPLAIPKLSRETDYYRVNFTLNEEKASELNRELRDKDSSEWYDPVAVVKKNAVPYFNIDENDQMKLMEADYSRGTALVEAKGEGKLNYIGLVQPKTKGQKGLWVLLYVESRSE
ncbi:MAG: LysM peptidoglycan-binding domain-containing protein [Candidatus Berkelbacteria bacterium]|nr:MAG: LysM peptidoglycan-binding domain-containing protein [Candidatus Berkelbacteria bacterium]QQG52112.1 MAG: LysM peptidoglycan-binding domain-containing protein [Candidatus Berkelbacteria bacterium]